MLFGISKFARLSLILTKICIFGGVGMRKGNASKYQPQNQCWSLQDFFAWKNYFPFKLNLLTKRNQNWRTDDDDVARKISEKLKLAGAQGISFCNIAKKAQELGRKDLAIKVNVTEFSLKKIRILDKTWFLIFRTLPPPFSTVCDCSFSS